MNRKSLIAAAVTVLLTAWLHWSMWQEPVPAPLPRKHAHRDDSWPPKRRDQSILSWLRPAPRVGSNVVTPPTPLTRQDAGSLVFSIPATDKLPAATLDFTPIQQSLRLLQPASPPAKDKTHVSLPDVSFLQWPAPVSVGRETLRTRRCRVINFYNPGTTENGGPHYAVRLFVDESNGQFMRMTTFDWNQKRTSTFSATTFRSVEGGLVPSRIEAVAYEPGTNRIAAETEFHAQ